MAFGWHPNMPSCRVGPSDRPRPAVATHSDRIHVVEEEETVAAKQILHIVLGGRDEDVDALVFEQGVESRRVEGRVLCLIMSGFVHVVLLLLGGHLKLTLRTGAGLP